MEDIKKVILNLNVDNTPMTDEEYKELMKFDSDDKEIDISKVEFRISTAKEIRDYFNISEFMKSEGKDDEN